MNQPTLYLMLGYPGSGKTTASKFIHELTDASHIWADHERKKRFINPTYTHKENLKLYAALNEWAEQLLSEGKSVIFDTNFNFYKDREHLRKIAAAHDAHSVVVWVKTPKDLARERATQNAHKQHTRVLGDMPPHHFERISNNLQTPRPSETVIELEGIDLTKEEIAQALAAYEASQ